MIVPPIVCRAFIGRRDELAFLRERRALAAASRGSLVLVAGEAGIGKSRLLDEFISGISKSHRQIAHAYCLEHAQRPYGPLLDALAALEGAPVVLQPEAARREQFDAIVRRFERAAERKAIVVVLEDLHWADVATFELLAVLAPKLERSRILLIASHRPIDQTVDAVAQSGLARLMRVARSGRIELGPLDERALRLFIDDAAGDFVISDETRLTVARTSEGNPFFAEELLKSAIERMSAGLPNAERIDLPSTLRTTLLERWHELPEAHRRVIAQAAVIGRTFDVSLLATTLETSSQACLESLARAKDLQFVEALDTERFRFRHALTREAIYEGFLEAQRRPLHRTIALALEAMPEDLRSLESIAYHWWAADDGENAMRYNERAGDAAGSIHAHEDAIALYERALTAATLSELDRGRIAEKIADRCYALGLTQRTHASYGIAAAHFERARDDEQEARCRTREALAAYTLRLDDPTAPLVAMLERLDADAFLARSRVHLGVAWLQASFWFPSEAAHHLGLVDRRALEVAELALRFHNVAAWVAMTFGDLETFREEFALWLESARDVGNYAVALAHVNGSWCHTIFGLHEEAIEHVERALTIARSERHRLLEEATYGHAAVCFVAAGDLQRARAALANIPANLGSFTTLVHAISSGTLAAIHLEDDELLATWFDGAAQSAIASPEISCGEGFAKVLVRRGSDADAADVLARALPRCELVRGGTGTLIATARYGRFVDIERARALLVAASNSPVEMLESPALELFDAYLARRDGHHANAIMRARAAADGFRRLRAPLLEAEAHELAGDYESARTIYERCDAVGDVRRIWTQREVSSRVPSAGGTNGAVLSDRQAQIVALVARGKSNLEIAQALSISPKTVEKHLGSIYQRLGFSSRVQLAAHVAGLQP